MNKDDYLSFANTHPELFVNPSKGGFTILLNEEEIREAEASIKESLKKRGLPTEWAEVGIAYEGLWGLVLRDAVRFPDGSLGTYYRLISTKNTQGVVVLPFYQEHIILVRRFRYATRAWHLEVPVGSGIDELSGRELAEKELREEIGGTVIRLISIGCMEAGPGLASESAEIFYADIEAYEGPNREAGIDEILLVTVSKFERMIRNNEITDLFTILAYIKAKASRIL
jgi:ADP-ribose pyrophosphatase